MGDASDEVRVQPANLLTLVTHVTPVTPVTYITSITSITSITPVPPLRLSLLILATFFLQGCYLMQAARGQMEITSKRRPITKVIQNPATDPSLRGRLQYITAAREFASSALGLPDNESYRSYADLGRQFVVWNVFATKEFSVEPKRWCFPIAGCVVYRGYFNEDAARNYAQRLARRGYDTAVGGVAAYSTLGHFEDPVLNTMLRWSDAQLASTLFHELAHQVVYIAGDSDFNEGFATVVEEAGLQRWLATRGAAGQLDAWSEKRARNVRFIELLLRTREDLKELYRLDLPVEEMRSRKQYRFGVLKLDYERLKNQWNGYSGYDAWFDRTLNNAHLVSAATYHGCVPALRRVLHSLGGDLEAFYKHMKELARDDRKKERAALCREGINEESESEDEAVSAVRDERRWD